VAQIEAIGRGRVLPVQLDLTEPGAAEAAVRTVHVGLGPIDVLVNNAVSHHGNNIHVAELTPAVIRENLLANAAQPLSLIALVLPGMIERGSGCIVNLLSGAGLRDPGAPALQGGWGVLYGMHKAAMNRIAGVVAVEAAGSGVLCFGLNPGFVKTAVVGALPGFDTIEGTPEEVPAEVVAWLATSPDAAAYNGQGVDALEVARDHGLLAG
jgi:NAD(P)-dependent dehydrogenase (short-subunit alcohol dehydrogenase family)